MKTLFKMHLLHLWRTKLIWVLILFSFLVQFSVIKVIRMATLTVNQEQVLFGARELLSVQAWMQVCLGAFLAFIYGIWMVPYFHGGHRGALLYTWPVSKWFYPITYGITFWAMICLQYLVLLLSLGFVIDLGVYASPEFPWGALAGSFVVTSLGCLVLLFFSSIMSLAFGKLLSFFLIAMGVFVLQISGFAFRTDMVNALIEKSTGVWVVHKVYQFSPPFGELTSQVSELFNDLPPSALQYIMWVCWLLAFAALFRVMLSYPMRAKN